MAIDNRNQNEDFLLILEEIRKQLLDASTYFDIWIQLWPTTTAVEVINRYKGFFQPIRQAILDQFFIKICNVISNNVTCPNKGYHPLSLSYR